MRATLPRALMISPEFPYPPISGGTQRTFYLLRALTERYRTDLLTFSEQPQPEAQAALEAMGARVHVIRLPYHAKTFGAFLRRNLSRAIRGVNPLMDRFSEQPVRQAVRHHLETNSYELIVLEHSWIAHYIDDIRSSPNHHALCVLDAVDVNSNLWRQYYQQPDRWYHKPALYRYWRAAETHERTYVPRFDAVLAISSSDAADIRRLAPQTTILQVPNGIEIDPSKGPASADRLPIIGFIGSLDYPPNALGLQWFLTSIWPQIKPRALHAQCLIIGRGASPKLVQRCQSDEQIRLAGFVPDLAPYLNRIGVMVVPLQHGSGTRIKILEAWAHGIPVVSTSKGAEGLDYTHMENIWIADRPDDFATAVVYLLSDAALRERLSRTAYQHVQQYAWSAIGRHLLDQLDHYQANRPVRR